MEKVLLLGRKQDPHIIGIAKELKTLGENYLILDQFSKSDSFYVKFDDTTTCLIESEGRKIPGNEIKSVWNSDALKINTHEKILEEAKMFVRGEWTEGILSLWNSIDALWVNHPAVIGSVSNRLKQLDFAKKIGLPTPKTLITNDPEQLGKFFEECNGEIIAKTLNSSSGLPGGKMIFTTKITQKDLENSDLLRQSPCVFQEYIPKKTEFRVTMIGKKIHAVEIHSQNSPKTKHDWRQYDDFQKTPYVYTDLPAKISHKLQQIMKDMKLEFGGCDLIRTRDDDYVFLEINPNGRWWWIQELTRVNMAKDIALHLAKTN